MLLEVTARRNDARVVFDLLRFDWLRCGHRFLSECLRLPEDDEQASALKKRLFQALPESMAGIYDRGEKNQVCKRGLFAGFSERGLRELGFADQRGDGYLCFLPERETGLHGFSRVVRPACP
jgi:hypothetical protein